MNIRGKIDAKRRRWFALSLSSLTLAMLFVLAACQPVQPPSGSGVAAPLSTNDIPAVEIIATDTSFVVPDEIPAGLVTLSLRNDGQFSHHAIIGRMFDDVTLDQVGEMLARETEGEVFGDLDMFMPDTDPGRSNNVTLDMPPGRYAVFSFSMDEDMVPDFAKGLLAEFTVTDGQSSTAAAPQADIVVTVSDDDFDMPAQVEAGERIVQVTNAGSADNAFVFFMQLRGDTTMDDILAMFETLFTTGEMVDVMPDFSAVGGLMTNSVSDTYWTTLDLEPGNYVAISNIGGNDFPYSGLAKNFTVK